MSFKEKWIKFRKSYLFLTIVFALMALLLIALDQITKWAVQNALNVEGNSIEVIPNFFYIYLTHNTAVAFSIGSGLGTGGRALNILISLAMSALFISYFVISRKKLSGFMKFLLMLLTAGAIGNLIDRIFYWEPIVGFDGVIDFMQFYLGGGPSRPSSVVNPFATFNLADAYLVVGVIIFIIYLIVDSIKNRNKDDDKPKPKPNPLMKGEISSEEKKNDE